MRSPSTVSFLQTAFQSTRGPRTANSELGVISIGSRFVGRRGVSGTTGPGRLQVHSWYS